MYGRRYGSRIGDIVGSAPWLNCDDELCVTFNVIPGVTVDPLSRKYTPMSTLEWSIVMAQSGVSNPGPNSIWGFQDDGSNLGVVLDVLGTNGLVNLTVSGSGQKYNQPVPGWNRQACQTVDGQPCGWINTSVGLNSALTSTLILTYIGFPVASPAANRDIFSNAVANTVQFNSTGKLTANYTLPVNLGSDDRSLVLPVISRINNTGLSSTCITNLEKVAGVYLLPVSGLTTSFGSLTNAGNIQYLYACEFGGAAAELTDNQIRSILQTLGWTVAW